NVVQKTSSDVTRFLSSAFVGTAALGSLSAILEKIHEIHHESSRFNIDAEALQRISVPAKEVGVNMETVARAMNALQIAGVKAAHNAPEFVAAFRQLNINVLEFNNLKPDQQILAVAEAFEKSAKTSDDYAAAAQ